MKSGNKRSQKIDINVVQPQDCFATPPEAVYPIMPFLNPSWRIWEPAEGQGDITKVLIDNGFQCYGTDLLTGHNFMYGSPIDGFSAIVTNPPFTAKYHFLKRAYKLGKPFAMIVPLETLGGQDVHNLGRRYGLEIMLLSNRVKYRKFDWADNSQSKPQFPSVWLCRDVLPERICYGYVPDPESY